MKNRTTLRKKNIYYKHISKKLSGKVKEYAIEKIAELENKIRELPKLYHFVKILESELNKEYANVSQAVPSQNDLKRWALKSAFVDFYKSFPDQNETLVDIYGSLTTKEKFAPNKKTIYDIWTKKLYELVKKNDRNRIDPDIYKDEMNETAENLEQGGSFEKRVERYREEIMRKVWENEQRKDK